MKNVNNIDFDPYENYDEELEGIQNEDETLIINDEAVNLDLVSFCIMSGNGILTGVTQEAYDEIEEFYCIEPSKFGLSILKEDEDEEIYN